MSYRNANPLSAFLAGFETVNRLEDARDQRAWNKEQRSRLRTMWDREDDEYTRLKLERYRGEKLAELDATMQSLMGEISSEAEGIADETERAKYLDSYFSANTSKDGKPYGRTRLYNEALKRMVAGDAEFGEHLALAVGLDPAEGSLIKNKNRPVGAVGVIPSELDPAGKGGMWFEVDSVNGLQPYTENRTSAPNDPVAMRQFTMREMVKAFGPGVMNNQFAIAAQLRDLAGAGQPTGNPSPYQDKAAQIGTQKTGTTVDSTATEVAPLPTPSQTTSLSEEEQQLPLAEQHRIAEERRQTAVDANKTAFEKIDNKRNQASFDAIDKASDESLPISSRTTGFLQLVGNELGRSADKLGATVKGSLVSVAQNIPTFGVDTSWGFIKDVAVELGTGSPPKSQGTGPIEALGSSIADTIQGNTEAAAKGEYPGIKVVDSSATSAADIKATGANPGDYTAAKLGTPGPAAATALINTPVPGTVSAVQSSANSLLSANRKPSMVDLYNAVGLTKLGVLTPEMLMNFASSGSLSGPAKADLQLVTDSKSGITTIIDKNTAQVVRRIRTGAGEAPKEGPSDVDIFKDQRTLIENSYRDKDGDIDEGKVQRTLQQIETASDILGLGDEARVDRSVLGSLTQGQRYVDNFSPDASQTFDFNPFSDPELGPNNMALGFMADRMGVVGQKNADRFLFDYGITFRNAFPNMTPEDLLRNVHAMELRAKNSNDLREEIVEATIDRARGK